jgi:phosphorylase kinase alpha/beta subunit
MTNEKFDIKLMLDKLYAILRKLRREHNLFIASPSEHYDAVWIRDALYIILSYLDKDCDTYETAMHALLDIMREYDWKIEIHTKQKPKESFEFIHAKYDAKTLKEIHKPWGHNQTDAVGMFLWAIAQGEKSGKTIIRDDKDREIIRMIVQYLITLQYWNNPENGMWEEGPEVYASSIGACVAGLEAIKEYVNVDTAFIFNGRRALYNMLPRESVSKAYDLAQLSLIYPYNLLSKAESMHILYNTETYLLRERGVIRYEADSYYSTAEPKYGRYHHDITVYLGSEAEWCFGIAWLGLCWLQLGYIDKAIEYRDWSRTLVQEDGSIAELYYAKTDKFNDNSPLGWSVSMHIQLEEQIENFLKSN